MNVVILNHYPNVLVDYVNWLKNFNGKYTLIIPDKYDKHFNTNSGYESVIGLKDYFNDNELSSVIASLNKKEKITHLISISEKDTQRAALLREYYGLNGQKMLSATLYRDKFWMKRRVEDAGILVPSYRLVHNIEDIKEFIKEHDYPVIIKPVSDADSNGVHKITGDKELGFFEPNSTRLVEKFIKCSHMYSIDGLVIDGKPIIIVAHRYHEKPMEIKNSTSFVIIEQLLPDDPMTVRLVDYQEKLLKHIPNSAKSFCFHTEVFHTDNDEIVFCETASRLAGARIPQMIKEAYEIDLEGLNIRTQLNIINKEELKIRKTPKSKVYSIFLPKRLGKILRFPCKEDIPFTWVTDFSPLVKVGDYISTKNGSTDVAAFIVLSIDISEDLNEKLNQLKKFLDDTIFYEDLKILK
jgi:hypothetical protein